MRNKYKPFFYDEKKTPLSQKIGLIVLILTILIFAGFQIPSVRQVIAEPVYSIGSFLWNGAKDLFAMTRMYHEEESPRKTYEPLELPERQVLFAESLESLASLSNLSSSTQADPLADLRITPTVSEYSRVAEWEYLDPNLNYAINNKGKPAEEITYIHLVPPVFERADLFNDGAAILSAVLRYWGKVENQYAISSSIHPDSLDPFTDFSDITGYLESNYADFSFLTRINGDKDTLISLLQAGIPIIVPVQFRTPYSFWPKDDHITIRYLLILGYESNSDTFFYQDTANGNTLEIDAESLLSAWYPFLRSYLVIYPEEMEDSISEALAENFYEELNLQRAELKFRTDSENLPQNAFAQYNYGAVLHRQGDDGGAWEAFQKATDLFLPQRYIIYQSDILETALNLGYADDLDEMIDPLLSLNSHDELLTVYKGWAEVLRGENRKGAELFDKASKINPNNETVLYALKYKETMMQF